MKTKELPTIYDLVADINDIDKVLAHLIEEIEKLKNQAKCTNCVKHTPKIKSGIL